MPNLPEFSRAANRFLLAAILALSVASTSWATAPKQQPPARGAWPVKRGPSHEPVPFHYRADAFKHAPASFLEDASACVIHAATWHLVDEDGTVETITHEVTRLNGRKGVEELGEFALISFDPKYQTLVLNLARIHKTDGSIVDIGPRHLQLRDASTDYQVYDQDKQLVISFPNLQPGDVYEVKWTVRGKHPEFGKHFFLRYSFGSDGYPTMRDELHVLLPHNRPLNFAPVNGKLRFTRQSQDERLHYCWSVKNRPRIPGEDDAPSREELRLQVVCSTFASWKQVAGWKAKVRDTCWECTPDIRAIVARVAPATLTPLARARALTYWVRQNIRYVSRGPGGLGYTPHTPRNVLKNLYGDCKDQAQLLAVMFREAGLPVYLVTLGIQGDGQVLPEVPCPWGTHAILLTKIDGQDHWIDTTASHGAWDALPRYCRDRQVYATNGADIHLLRTPVWTWKDHRYEAVTNATIQTDGTSEITRRLAFHGGAALYRRQIWMGAAAGERRRQISLELQDNHSRSRLEQFTVDDADLHNPDRPVTAQVAYSIRNHLTGDGNLEGSFTDSAVWNRLLAYNLDAERKLPMELAGPSDTLHRFRIQLPPAFRFNGSPRPADIRSRWGFFKLDVIQDKNNPRRLEIISHLRLEKARIEKEHFAEFHRFHEEIFKAYRFWLNVRPTRDLDDAPMLETLLALAPGCDRLSVETLVKLYLNHDRPREARRVLDQACFYFPGDSSLWEMKVKTAAHAADMESIYRDMVRFFPSEPRFALALGATLVQRYRHADACKVLEPLTSSDSPRVCSLAHFHLARSYFNDKKYGGALTHLRRIRSEDAGAFSAGSMEHLLGRIHEKLNDVPGAVVAYRGASQADPDNLVFLTDLIRTQMRQTHGSKTIDLVRVYTLKAGNDLPHVVQAAEFHYQLGRWDEAFELASRARDLGFHVRAQRLLGLVHLHRGQYAQAVFHLERADRDGVVQEALLRSYLALGQLDAAEDRLSSPPVQKSASLDALTREVMQLLERRGPLLKQGNFPANKPAAARRVVDAFLCAETMLVEKNLTNQAEMLLKKCFAEPGIELGPAYALRGWLSLSQGQFRLAERDAEVALKLGTTGPRAHFVRGRVRLMLGAKGSLADLEQAVKLSRHQDANMLHWLAAAQFQHGWRDQALRTQRQALALQPKNAEFQAQLDYFMR